MQLADRRMPVLRRILVFYLAAVFIIAAVVPVASAGLNSTLVIENFFGRLKEELFYCLRFLSIDSLATQLKECIRW